MNVRGPNNVAVQTDPTSLRYASAITEQTNCWELLTEKFDRFQTLRNNTQQHPTTCNRLCKRTQHLTSNNVGNCWPIMLRPFARGLRRSGTSFRHNDYWDRGGGQALLVIGCPPNCLSTETIPGIIALKSCTQSLVVSGGGNWVSQSWYYAVLLIDKILKEQYTNRKNFSFFDLLA